jgi:DNA integrity scanning protein DisA with diadenylate cyclase activity
MDINDNNINSDNLKKNNILKFNNLITKNDYENILLTQQTNKLYRINKKINEEKLKKYNSNKIYNISIKNILNNLTLSFIDIINDYSNYFKDNNKTFNGFFSILIYNDRLIYIGIFIILLSLILYFINITK